MVAWVSRIPLPVILSPRAGPRFPDPTLSDRRGLLALGGSLSPEWLLAAYDRGIFPWYDEGMPPLWWSPDPRAIMDRTRLHVSRSMSRLIRSGRFRVSFNRAFTAVMRACGEERDEGTWILPEMVDAYVRLHELGHAHSFEVWEGDTLAGGLYGVQRGGLFAAESMFHRAPNASKIALITSVGSLFRAGIRLFDVQFLTSHLVSMGAYEIPRREYLEQLDLALAAPLDLTGLVPDPLG
jgi:leucyl/phenylalanyl-tRNA---protein transferase